MQDIRPIFIAFFLLFFCIPSAAALPDNGTHWIRIQNLPDLQQRDIHNVTAVTNLPEGEEILYQVFVQRHCPKAGCGGNIWGAAGTIHVVKGSDSLNMTSFVIDASTLRPDEYLVTENAVYDNAHGEALFNVLNSPDKPYWIYFGPVHEAYTGEPLEIAGSTNLPVGEKIHGYLYRKNPDLIPISPVEDIVVTQGEHGPNLTIFKIEQGTLEPGEYTLESVGDWHYAEGNTTFYLSQKRTTAPGFGLVLSGIGLLIAAVVLLRQMKK